MVIGYITREYIIGGIIHDLTFCFIVPIIGSKMCKNSNLVHRVLSFKV